MKRDKNEYKELIIKLFKVHLYETVDVVIDHEQEDDYGIYRNPNSYDKENMESYAPDFIVGKSINEKWIYMILTYNPGRMYGGEVVEGPSANYNESNKFNSITEAITQLILAIIQDNINNNLIEFEMGY
jgi:hypothetical protein